MLKQNGIDLNILAETVLPNDIRLTTDWNQYKHRFIAPLNLFKADTLITDFKQNGKQWTVAKKGTRPLLKLRTAAEAIDYNTIKLPYWIKREWEGPEWTKRYCSQADKYLHRLRLLGHPTNALGGGVFKLIKFNTKAVMLIAYPQAEQYTYNSVPPTPDNEFIYLVATPEEDLKTILVELQAGGGSGANAGVWTCGTGGASGAYVFCALNLEHPATMINGKNNIGVKGRNPNDKNLPGIIQQNEFVITLSNLGLGRGKQQFQTPDGKEITETIKGHGSASPSSIGAGSAAMIDESGHPTSENAYRNEYTGALIGLPGGQGGSETDDWYGQSTPLFDNSHDYPELIHVFHTRVGLNGGGSGTATVTALDNAGFLLSSEHGTHLVRESNDTAGGYGGRGAGSLLGPGSNGKAGSAARGWDSPSPGAAGGGGTVTRGSGGHGTPGLLILY